MSSHHRIWPWLFLPFTIWYAVGVFIRNMLFELGIKRQQAPQVMTIGVGNLCMGGSGKTPMVEYLLRLLSENQPTALLSRGYGRKTHGFILNDGSCNPQQLGDEMAMMAKKFPKVKASVCEKRVEGIKQLLSLPDAPQLVVLDDVFQHRYVKPTINILLTEYQHPFSRDHILPFGNLREFRSAKQRANVVVVTKCPNPIPPIEKQNLIIELGLTSFQHIFFACVDYGVPYRLTLHGSVSTQDNPLDQVDHVLLVTGIANPTPLVDYVKQRCTVTHLSFPDHHTFNARDLRNIIEKYNAIPGERKLLLTTEKDATRLQLESLAILLEAVPQLYVQPITMRFLDEKGISFDSMIGSLVKENIHFLTKLKTSKLNNYI